MKYIRSLILSSLALVLCHCSSLNLVIPTATIESPETLGRTWQVEVGPSLEPAHGIQYSPDVSARPPSMDSPSYIGTTHSLQHRVSFGVAERFQWGVAFGWDTVGDGLLGIEGGISESYLATAKFQFLGNPRNKAKAGDVSAGVFTKIMYADNSKTGDQSTTFGPAGYNWKADVTAKTLLLGLTTGYRLFDNWLIYGGGSYQKIQSTIVVNHDVSADLSDPGGAYTRDRNGFSSALGLGSQLGLGKVIALNAKVMWVQFEIDGLVKEESVTAAGGMSFSW